MLPARWREAKAAGNPPCHPGQGRASKSVQLLSGTVLLSIDHIRATCRGGRSLATGLQARDAGLKVDHRHQDVTPQPRGSSHLLKLASSPSDLSTLLESPPSPPCCGEGSGLLFVRLGIKPHACQMVSRANVGEAANSGHPG